MEQVPIIALAPNTWDAIWADRQYLLNGLARRGWPVVYSRGAFSWWERGDPRWKQAPLRDGFHWSDGVLVHQPGRLLCRWPGFRAWDKVAMRLHARRLVAQARALSDRPCLLMVFHPKLAEYARVLDHQSLVYHIHDAHERSPSATGASDAAARGLIERADLTIAVAPNMLPQTGLGAALRHDPERVKFLAHGADFDRIIQALSDREPDDLAPIPHPRIGYFGNLNYKVDFAAITATATARPDWHWVLIGPVGQGGSDRFPADVAHQTLWERCRSLPNVHVLGQKSRWDIPAYGHHMDVNALCYRTDGDGWWKYVYPLKLFEYLTIGRPIVASDIENVRPYAPYLAIARSHADWIDALDRATTGRGVSTLMERRALAARNSWDTRVDHLEQWLFDLAHSPAHANDAAPAMPHEPALVLD